MVSFPIRIAISDGRTCISLYSQVVSLVKIPNNWHVVLTISLAFVFWYITFAAKLMNFWLSMSIATTALAILATYFGGFAMRKDEANLRNFVVGVVSATVLYAIFTAGNYLSMMIFHFAKPEISAIYDIRYQGQKFAISFVLLFITSPGEELFWRAFLQRWAMSHFGRPRGWLICSFLYAAVHVLSGNVMLTMAAFIVGLFWGLLYWKSNSTFACIVSHALWTVSIFVIWPVL
jgi:membrane protease YdiL (CAAX protease family)